MRVLIDESLSIRIARALVEAGHDAIHVGDLDLLGAEDTVIMANAREQNRCVISADTDFGELLALGRHHSPSVILLRRSPRRPTDQVDLLIAALPELEADVDEGAVVILQPGRARVRRLPIDPSD